MTTVADAIENVVWAAADAFLSDNLDDILNEIFERVDEEETDDLEGMVEEVVSEWISQTPIYDQIEEYINQQIDDECMYTDDCMEIITDYGFSYSLSAAGERRHRRLKPLSTNRETRSVSKDEQAFGLRIRRTCGGEMGCDLSDVTETAVASAVLMMNSPSEDTMQDEIVRQIQETTAFRNRAEVAGF